MTVALDEIPRAPGTRREAFATVPDTAVPVMGGAPGTHAVSDWEACRLEAGRRA